MFARAQLLRKGYEQRPSSQDDLDPSVMGEDGNLLQGLDLLLISVLYRST
jgi:hypothetical protein